MSVFYACGCNWDIPGVERLPAHSHHQRFDKATRRMIPDIKVWVNWKEVARSL